MQVKRVRTSDEKNKTATLLSRSGTGMTGYVVGDPKVNFFKEVNALIAQYEGDGGMINAAGSAVSGLYSVVSSYTGTDIAGWGFKTGDIIPYLNSDLGQKFLAIN
ncbi:MAG: hypothetical protein VX335_00120 [Pseudomonadota bacterium]|nr:hypothetical protein [Pseudomonadota bacterium]